MSLPQFYYWRRRLRNGAGLATVRPARAIEVPLPAFVELGDGGADPSTSLEIRLELGGGCTLCIRRG
ncbi:MAG: hypothetical protein AB7T01_02325 [Acidithiobacillus sp.]